MKLKKFGIPVIWLLYSALVLFGVYHHEPWRDEAHAWMTARENSLPTLLSNVKYEATPLLWYLILMPFAQAGFPFETMQLIHALLAITAVTLLLYRSGLPVGIRILIIFSYPIAYEYAVVSRNYVLTAGLLFAIAYNYRERLTNPFRYAVLVALLYQTNLHSMVPAFLLSFNYLADLYIKKLWTVYSRSGVVLLFITAIFSFLTIIPDTSLPSREYRSPGIISGLPRVLRETMLPENRYTAFGLTSYSGSEFTVSLLTALVICGFFLMIIRETKLTFLALGIFGWLFTSFMIHSSSVRHHGLLFLYLILLYWLSKTPEFRHRINLTAERFIFLPSLTGLLFLSSFFTVEAFYLDFISEFSGAKQTAAFIEDRRLTRYPLAAYVGSHSISLYPYFSSISLWHPENESDAYSNMQDQRYGLLFDSLPAASAEQKTYLHFAESEPHILIWTYPLPDAETRGYSLLFSTDANQIGYMENFWIYGKNLPAEHL